MKLFGKSPIHPILFITGKFAGYLLWSIVILDFLGFYVWHPYVSFPIVAYVLFALGFGVTIESLVHLGKSTSFGLPKEKTVFKREGLYKYSRNPMYIGFHLMTIAGMLASIHPVSIILGVFCIATYHIIIRAEEDFLEKRFRKEYALYEKNVRRYI